MSMPLHPPTSNPEGSASNEGYPLNPMGLPEGIPTPESEPVDMSKWYNKAGGFILDHYVLMAHALIDNGIAGAGATGRFVGEAAHTAVESSANAGNRLRNRATDARMTRMQRKLPYLGDKIQDTVGDGQVHIDAADYNLDKRAVSTEELLIPNSHRSKDQQVKSILSYDPRDSFKAQTKPRALRSIPVTSNEDGKPKQEGAEEAKSAFESRVLASPRKTLQHQGQLRAGRRNDKSGRKAAEANRLVEHYGDIVKAKPHEVEDYIRVNRLRRGDANSLRKAQRYVNKMGRQINGKDVRISGMGFSIKGRDVKLSPDIRFRINGTDDRLRKTSAGSDLSGRFIERRTDKIADKISKFQDKVPELAEKAQERYNTRAKRLRVRDARRREHVVARTVRRGARQVTRQATRKYIADQQTRRKAGQKTPPTPTV